MISYFKSDFRSDGFTLISKLVESQTRRDWPLAVATLKPVDQLTESERFAIVAGSGVPFKEIVIADGTMRLVTEPCDIVIQNGQYVVLWRKSK